MSINCILKLYEMHIAVTLLMQIESWPILLQRHLIETQMNQVMPNVLTMHKFNIQHSFKSNFFAAWVEWGRKVGKDLRNMLFSLIKLFITVFWVCVYLF